MATKEDQLLKKLQQAFKNIFEFESRIVSSHQETKPALTSLENLSEQLQCVQKIKFQDTPLASFTDLQSNLNFKLCDEILVKVQQLKQFCDLLQEFSNCLDRHYRTIMGLYSNFSNDLNVCDVCKAQPARPSIATMMEWLDDLNQDVFVLYEHKNQLLLNLDCRSNESVQRLIKEWAYDEKLNKKIKELMCYLKYFIDESL